jgi:hypothetical protein
LILETESEGPASPAGNADLFCQGVMAIEAVVTPGVILGSLFCSAAGDHRLGEKPVHHR